MLHVNNNVANVGSKIIPSIRLYNIRRCRCIFLTAIKYIMFTIIDAKIKGIKNNNNRSYN